MRTAGEGEEEEEDVGEEEEKVRQIIALCAPDALKSQSAHEQKITAR